MTIYLGPPGNLQALPYMGRGIGAPLDLGASVHRALGGVRTVDYVGDPKRTYTMERKYLTQDELSVLEGLALGAYGDPSSLVLVDPFRRNMLTENQSTGGDYSRDSSGFYCPTPSATLSAVGPATATALRGFYALRMTYTGSTLSPPVRTADLTSAATIIATATPVRAGVDHTFSVSLRHAAGTIASWKVGINYYDAAGALLTSTTSTAAALTSSYVQRTLTVTAGATAAYAVCFWLPNANLTAPETVDGDDVMLTQGTSTTWTMGTGVPRVAFVGSLDLSYPTIVGDNDLGVTLQEVA